MTISFIRFVVVVNAFFIIKPSNLRATINDYLRKMEEEEIILEEETIISESQDGNIMELIKTESAEMNIQIYVLSVISLGH